MDIFGMLNPVWADSPEPFLWYGSTPAYFADLIHDQNCTADIPEGSIVAIIGDFTPQTISLFLHLIAKKAIIVPLTNETAPYHEQFLTTACVQYVIRNATLQRRPEQKTHSLLRGLQASGHPGLILFSSGSTGTPKAIVHDLTLFLRRYATPRPALRTVAFLLFDHIGGLNTLFHTLFSKGTFIVPKTRTIDAILTACATYKAEVLPTTPTFLRMLLFAGNLADLPPSLTIITYGTERMDQPTLDRLCSELPRIDFRQTYGMTELGILRVSSEKRDSLYMKIGGEGVETKTAGSVLYIRSDARMLGYLNAPSPFDAEGWYCTNDIVDVKENFYAIKGRKDDVINIGGLKCLPADIEKAALSIPGVLFAKAYGKDNPITGQHAELSIQPAESKIPPCQAAVLKKTVMETLSKTLPRHMVPARVRIEPVEVSHRFKKR